MTRGRVRCAPKHTRIKAISFDVKFVIFCIWRQNFYLTSGTSNKLLSDVKTVIWRGFKSHSERSFRTFRTHSNTSRNTFLRISWKKTAWGSRHRHQSRVDWRRSYLPPPWLGAEWGVHPNTQESKPSHLTSSLLFISTIHRFSHLIFVQRIVSKNDIFYPADYKYG